MDYTRLWIIFLGSIFFMFVIMYYVYRLSRRKPDYKSSWMMIVAGHMAVFAGIMFSVIFTLILCFAYIPVFLSGDSENMLKNAADSLNDKNSNLVLILFLCAVIENFGAAGFIAILGPYVFKTNLAKDKTAVLEKEFNPRIKLPSKGEQNNNFL